MSRQPVPSAAVDLLIPAPGITGYSMQELLGSGSSGHTWKAMRDGTYYAVKVFNEFPAGATAVRLVREIETLKLEHPNLVCYEDSGIGIYGGLRRPYIAMPFHPGRTLREAIDAPEPRLSIEQVTQIGVATADGLGFLHEHNVVHRDLNPKNIYLTDAGGVLIIDFGLARMQDLASLTLDGQVLGTYGYCAPEQLRGEPDLHSDLYALGATLYHALCGCVPFSGDHGVQALFEMIRNEEPEPLTAHNPAVSPRLEQLILALLAKEPLQRPSSAKLVAVNLRAPRQAPKVTPEPYRRDQMPILAVRATTPAAGRAVVGAAMLGDAPEIAVAPITTPAVLEELVRARGFDSQMKLAVDTRVETTARLGMPEAVRRQGYAPLDGRPYRHEDLRDVDQCKRVGRGDIQAQDAHGASLLRSACLPISGPEDGWVKRNPRLLEVQLAARDARNAEAPLFAMVRCEVEALVRVEDRISMANRFSRGTPQGFWFEVYGLSIHSPPEAIAAAMEMFLLTQERGVGVIASLPGPLVELAWSIGVAGAEVKLGRVGGVQAPTIRVPGNVDRRARFELPSVFASFNPDDAADLLRAGELPESDCSCPSCCLGASHRERVKHGEAHGLSAWLGVQRSFAALIVADRIERLEARFAQAEELLHASRGALRKSSGSTRHIARLRATLELLERQGALDPVGALRRPV